MALGVSLVVSALLTATALRLPDQHWLAWISFLPLFVVVRSLRSPVAALAGGFWGGCLHLFCSAFAASTVDTVASATTPTVPAIGLSLCVHAQAGPSARLLALLIVIPAVYVGLAARPARCGTGTCKRAGPLSVSSTINLLTLALGWTLIEVVLHLHDRFGPHDGLLTGSQGEAPHLHWLARLFGYVCTAFLVACANASLVGILSGARLSFSAYMSLAASRHTVGWVPSNVVLAKQCWTLRRAHPRAPPFEGASMTQ